MSESEKKRDNLSDLEQACKVLTKIGQRAVADPDFRNELKKNQLSLMKAAGMSIVALSRAQGACGVSEKELVEFGLSLSAADPDDALELKLTNWCVGTCKNATVWVCGGCTNSILTSNPNS